MDKPLSSGADAVVAALQSAGVETVFGMPGTQNIPLFDALRRSRIRTVLATSEAMAGFMAIGAFRATGKPAVFLAIPGPGFAFSVLPLAEAALDSSGIVLITGPVVSRGKVFDHQVIDQHAISAALTGSIVDVTDSDRVFQTVRDALRDATATGGRPVVLQVSGSVLEAENVSAGTIESGAPPGAPTGALPDTVRDAINQAERPVIFAGSGTLNCAPALREFADSLNAAVVTTAGARGVIPEGDQCVVGVDALCDDVEALNALVAESDLVIALGCRFSHNTTAGFRWSVPGERLVHVHADKQVLDANYPAKWALEMPVAEFIRLLQGLQGAGCAGVARGWSQEEMKEWRQRIRTRIPDANSEPKFPALPERGCRSVLDAVRSALPDDGIVVTDSGLHQIATRKYFEVRAPRGLIVPTDFQSMGFGIPAAIGATLSAPARRVVAIIGDGSFLMAMPELATIAREQVPLVLIVLSDGWLGQIRSQQVQWGAEEFSTKLHPIDMAAVAAAFGIRYVRADQNIANQVRHCLEPGAPAIIEVTLDDPQGLARLKRDNRIKGGIRKLLGPAGTAFLKRLTGRSGE